MYGSEAAEELQKNGQRTTDSTQFTWISGKVCY